LSVPLASCQNLVMDYGGGTRIGPINLELLAGNVVALVGVNGAGKTTLLHMLLGLRRPTSGAAMLLGKSSSIPESRAGVGYLPEAVDFPERSHAIDLLKLHARLTDTPLQTQSQFEKYLDDFGLEYTDKPLKFYSKGMKQRLALSIAMMDCRRLLILDEPNSGLDPVGIAMLRAKLDQLKSTGVGLIISTHRLAEVMQVADRAIVLHKGSIAGDAPMSEFENFSAFENYFLERAQ
jgi:ABC-type multidrug transport system ATPase subunit